MGVSIARERNPAASRLLLENLTARLPEWFAQPESNRHYAEQAEILEAWVARLDGSVRGLLLLKRHSAVSAEVYWLERNAMRWNRMRFHLIAFARTGDACCRRHDGSS